MEDLRFDAICSAEENEPTLSDTQVVGKIMTFAKLDLQQVGSNVEQLFFSPTLSNNSVKLLELNEQTLSHLESGGDLILKGEGSENVVLCTERQTFDVKDTEISNSLLIVPKLRFAEGSASAITTTTTSNAAQGTAGTSETASATSSRSNPVRKCLTSLPTKETHATEDCDTVGRSGVAGVDEKLDALANELQIEKVSIDSISHSYLELKQIKPKLHTVMDLLRPSLYKGPECEELASQDLVTRDDLESRVLASREEIDLALTVLDVIDVDGYIRLIDFDYLSRVLGSITALLDENSWRYDNFKRADVLLVLKDLYPELVVGRVLELYGHPRSKDGVADSWSLDDDKVSRFFAELLLRPTKVFNLSEFMDAWKNSVPDDMVTSQDQLQGLAFTDSSSSPAVIKYFPEAELSEDVKERFEQLFQAKSIWSLGEITPYLERLCIGKLTPSVLVTKYARACKKNGVKCYTAKYFK